MRYRSTESASGGLHQENGLAKAIASGSACIVELDCVPCRALQHQHQCESRPGENAGRNCLT